MISKIYDRLHDCVYDSSGLNMSWLTAISVDERSMLKKFFRDSGNQFCELKDFWVEEFCRKVQSIELAPGTVLKARDHEPDRIYILITGKVSVHSPLWNSRETVLLNEYYPGQSVCDPYRNETAPLASLVTVTSRKPAKLFYLTKSAYEQIYIDKLNEVARKRVRMLKENFAPFNAWEDMRLKHLLIGSKQRVLAEGECLIRE